MRFAIEIELGNVAMTSRTHIAGALREVARKLENIADGKLKTDGHAIMDSNGNKVGEWELTKE